MFSKLIKIFVLFQLTLQMSFAQDAVKGASLFQAKCSSCHGGDAMGSESSKAPMLAGQHDWYLLTSFDNFSDNSRKHPLGSNYWKSQLTSSDKSDLAAYLSKK